MHTALWVLAATSLVGAVRLAAAPAHASAGRRGRTERAALSAAARRCASARSPSRVGTTPRTIRYYEEIGLLPAAGDRERGRHRIYDEARRRAAARGCCA